MSGWRPMEKADLPWVNAIAAQVHAEYPESPAVFANRLALFPTGCWMAEDGSSLPVGYAIAHPARLGHPPELDQVLPGLEGTADCLYLHDVALLDRARGHGLGRALLPLLDQLASRHMLACIALTAVSGSHGFWGHYGFSSQPCDHLESYGQALYMVRNARISG